MEINRDHQQNFDQGRLRALEIAFETFIRMQQEVPQDLYREVLAKNAETWSEATLDMTVTDEYRRGADFGFRMLLSGISGSGRD